MMTAKEYATMIFNQTSGDYHTALRELFIEFRSVRFDGGQHHSAYFADIVLELNELCEFKKPE